MSWGPESVGRFLAENMHRLDNPAQWLGNEPNVPSKDWDASAVRVLMAASWPYEQAAGNQSVPAVWKTVNSLRNFLCDRYYLPSTSRDMKIFERAGVPVFGLEHRHPLGEYDVVGTSISYILLLMNFCRYLSMSEVPLRWRDRVPEEHPMVMIGGQAFCNPEAMAPVADCVFVGEAEDEPGNGGLGQVLRMIEMFKQEGSWNADRVACYQRLARTFNYLYFPRFVRVDYAEDSGSRLVSGYRSDVDGMRMPFRKRHVIDLDKIEPLDAPPLLYTDPSMGSGDLETSRGCPAWSIPQDTRVEVAGRGSVPFFTVRAGEEIRVGQDYRRVASVVLHGEKYTVAVQTRQGHELECTPEHEVLVVRGPVPAESRDKRAWLNGAPRTWVQASDLCPGDFLLRTVGGVSWPENFVSVRYAELEHRVGRGRALRFYTTLFPEEVTPDLGWFLGMVTGDCYVRGNQLEFRVERQAEALAARLRAVTKELFDVDLTEYPSASGESVHLNLNSARVVRWLASNFGIRTSASRKRVPDVIFASPRPVVASYLSALYDSNGTSLIPKSGTSSVTIRFVAYSEEQIRGVAELLRMLGLPSGVRSELRDIARSGAPAARPSRKWECRTAASDCEDAYTWLESLEPFKARYLDQFRPPAARSSAQGGLSYLEVTGTVPRRVTGVMDVDVPGPQAFNVGGIYVHNCSFCRLTFAQKPFRQKSVGRSAAAARAFRNNVGGVEISPFGPDFPMQTNKNALLKELLETVSDKVDTVAQRIDDFISDETYLLLQAAGGARSITLGLEGVSQRMRDLVGKATSDAEVREAVARGIRAGFRKFKLFMIVGLPGENTGDVARIMQLARDIADIRDSLAADKVLIQFSFTPLLYEAQTPFQWFSCWPVPDHDLIDVANELRELKILFKIGTKAEPNKVHFFQLCQRASREAGEAVIDVLEDLGTGCWGGVPKDMTVRLESALRRHGFSQGFGDLFGERTRGDMLGWEFIDTGVSRDLLWDTYAQMRDFSLYTDSADYDSKFDERYHGNEWIDRCDERCLGRSCGVCGAEDLRLRRDYISVSARDRGVDVSSLRAVDQTTVAVRVRARLSRPEAFRWADNEFRRHLIRRAGYRLQDSLGGPCVSKHSIWFASDAHGYRDWTCGTDYAEFGLTERLHVSDGMERRWMGGLGAELAPWITLDDYIVFPASVSMRSGAGASLHYLEIAESPDRVRAWLRDWQAASRVPMRLRQEGSYFTAGVEEVNAKDFVDGLWLARNGTAVELRMLARRRAGPYQVWQSLSGKAGWIDAARHPARTIEVFAGNEGVLACTACGWPIPESLLGVPWHEDYCPRCADEKAGIVLAGLDREMT
jgi:radical SAM family protein